MGLVLGITVAVLTLPVAFLAMMSGSNWETGEGGSTTAGAVTLVVGEALAIFIIVSHYHPIHLSW